MRARNLLLQPELCPPAPPPHAAPVWEQGHPLDGCLPPPPLPAVVPSAAARPQPPPSRKGPPAPAWTTAPPRPSPRMPRPPPAASSAHAPRDALGCLGPRGATVCPELWPWQRLGREQVFRGRSCGCRWRGARRWVRTGTSGRRSQRGGRLSGRAGGSQGPGDRCPRRRVPPPPDLAPPISQPTAPSGLVLPG